MYINYKSGLNNNEREISIFFIKYTNSTTLKYII